MVQNLSYPQPLLTRHWNRVWFGSILTSSCILQRSVNSCNNFNRINTVIIPHGTGCSYIYIYMVFFSVMSTNFSQFVAEVQTFLKTMPCCRDLSWTCLQHLHGLIAAVFGVTGPWICVLHQNTVGEHLVVSHFSAFSLGWFQFCEHLTFSSRWISLLPRQKPGKHLGNCFYSLCIVGPYWCVV